jgi:hypothetical protein
MDCKNLFILTSILFLSLTQGFSQGMCKVLKPEIADKYEGGCKKGLANGKGIAIGKDKYEGSFKKGYPHGTGVYTWSTGEVYDGSWKEGKRSGEGKYIFKKNGVDSVLFGLWSNDVFTKPIFPRPYKILVARNIDRYSVQKVGDGNSVSVELLRMGNTNPTVQDASFEADNGLSRLEGRKYVFYQLVFPTTISLKFTTISKFNAVPLNVIFEITISKKGEWEITINN